MHPQGCDTHEIHTGMIFSIGQGLPEILRSLIFIALPAVALILLLVYYFTSRDLLSLAVGAFLVVLSYLFHFQRSRS